MNSTEALGRQPSDDKPVTHDGDENPGAKPQEQPDDPHPDDEIIEKTIPKQPKEEK